jgi:MerR family transcriptional regulator, light-induced transcriptional regulator
MKAMTLPDSSAVRDAYLAALLETDPQGAQIVVQAALEAGLPIGELYLSVLQPALYEIGRLWEHGEVSVAQEHLATATTQTLMARLAAPPGAVAAGPRAITTATENDLHALGPRFLADFLERDGWRVIDLGADTPTHDLVHLVGQVRPELVCLSTTLTTNLGHAQDAITALRGLDPPPLIAVGGHAYETDDQLAATLGADIHAGDAGAFLEILHARLPRLSRS